MMWKGKLSTTGTKVWDGGMDGGLKGIDEGTKSIEIKA